MNKKIPNEYIPENVVNAQKFLAQIYAKNYSRKQSDNIKIADAKLIIASYGCQKEGLPVTVSNLIMILGSDAADTLKYLKPEQYSRYGIVDSKI